MKKFFLPSKKTEQKGFALLFTILIITLALNIGIGISTVAYKQTILSGLAKDSQLAFYQADAAVECGLYYDVTVNAFPDQYTDPATANDNYPSINCGGNTLFFNDSRSNKEDYFVYDRKSLSGNTPCMEVIFDHLNFPQKRVVGNGFSSCNFNPRQVERTLEVQY